MNKTIHAIWLGNKMTPLSLACVDDWSKQNYTVKLWTENDSEIMTWINDCEFARKCFERGLYAFVTDYLRLKVLYKYGGLYLDTDVTIQKDPFELFNGVNFSVGYEDEHNLGTAIIYSQKESQILNELIHFYENEIMSSSLYMGPKIMTELVINRGHKNLESNHIYQPEYFYAYQGESFFFDKTNNCYLIHWYQHSWNDPKKEIFIKSKHLGILGKIYVWQKCFFRIKKSKK